MRHVMLVVPAALVAAALVVAGMWAWQGAGDWVLDWNVGRPDVAVWAVRSASVAAIAAAQVILLALVCARLYGRGAFDSALAYTAGAACALACVSALACGLAAR